MPSRLRHLSATLAIAAVAGLPVRAGSLPTERTEPEAKAILLQKVLAFVTWPKADKPGTQPLKIAFLGQSPVAREFTRLLNDRSAGNLPFEVHYESLNSNLDDYQVVFLPLSNARRAQALAEKVAARGVLTVGESAGGCDKGIVLTLLVAEDRIHYEINLKQARRAGLTINSQVLQRAARVCEGGLQ
jgi:hypothetical protein